MGSLQLSGILLRDDSLHFYGILRGMARLQLVCLSDIWLASSSCIHLRFGSFDHRGMLYSLTRLLILVFFFVMARFCSKVYSLILAY